MFHGVPVYMHKQTIMYTDMTTYINQTTLGLHKYISTNKKLKKKKH